MQSGAPPYTPGYGGAAATYDGIVPADDALAVDSSGNIYTAGGFSGTVDFNPSDAGVANLTGCYYCKYFSKLDSSGNYVWAKKIENLYELSSIAVDSSGNMYAVGRFSGTVDLDPGAGTANLTATSGYDVFVL